MSVYQFNSLRRAKEGFMFLKYLVIFCFLLGLWGCKDVLNNQRPPRRPTTPPPDTTSDDITVYGMMNINDNEAYKSILESSGLCRSKGFFGGTSRCSTWTSQPMVTLTFNGSLTKVKGVSLTPRGSKFPVKGKSGMAIPLLISNDNVIPINESEGWEVRLLSGRGIYSFEMRLRCEACSIETQEFVDIDIYQGSDRSQKIGHIPSMFESSADFLQTTI